ncbi:hypothetical protein VTN77DRAFT_6179 [Rasamsonia byssochlamydoides]|uniref:uncharacterized protein n=1 Tax=Rasamsonia byssochlamydoides TaxID=89139 RepID=UPI0037427C09
MDKSTQIQIHDPTPPYNNDNHNYNGDEQQQQQQEELEEEEEEESLKKAFQRRAESTHGRLPGIRKIPLPAIGIILLIAVVNLVVWAVVGIVLHFYPSLISTAAISYSLGLRHALDADHISAIDLMTRRLLATGQKPVTVGTFFSLGHSTIVIITSIVVAATAAAVSKRFDSFSTVGGIIGSSVSAAFLILLGIMNAYILYKLIQQMRKVLNLREDEEAEMWKIEGGGLLFAALKRMFKLIDRPWKMYPLGILFGLGFDTSSEIALLGISSIQAARGTDFWVILIFPILFTAGMCLLDTADGALMLSLYIQPATNFLPPKPKLKSSSSPSHTDRNTAQQQPLTVHDDDTRALQDRTPSSTVVAAANPAQNPDPNPRDPIAFLYYSIVLTTLTVLVAIIIGILQLLTLILNVASPTGTFWDGVQTAGDYYDVIGGGICGCFIVFGLLSVVLYGPWRRWVGKRRRRVVDEESDSGRDGGGRDSDDGRAAADKIGPTGVDIDVDGDDNTIINIVTADSSVPHHATQSSASSPGKVEGEEKDKDKSGPAEIAIRPAKD